MNQYITDIREPKSLLLVWRSPNPNEGYYAIAKLERREGKKIVFSYLINDPDYLHAKKVGFDDYPAFRKNKIEYDSNVLDIFMTRLPPRKRSDFNDYLAQLRISPNAEISDFALLAYGNAALATDNFRLIDTLENLRVPCEFIMEVSGVRHHNYKKEIPINDPVYFCEEPDNKYDKNAIKVLNNENMIGYVSKFQCKAFKEILKSYYVSGRILKRNGTEESPRVFLRVRIDKLP